MKKIKSSILTSEEIKRSFPLLNDDFIINSRQTAKNILNGKDKRKVVIFGPCSVHDYLSLMDYAKKFKKLSDKVKNTFFCVLRFFIEKPRTHLGWKGYIYDPLLDGSNDIALGIMESRKMLVELANMQIPCAMEFLDPLVSKYFDDLITWGFIGSRTCSSQIHRQLSSSLPFPIGFKNPSDGDILSSVLSAHSAKLPHSFLSVDETGQINLKNSEGNPYTHIVLRGSVKNSNYSANCINEAYNLVSKYPIINKLLIDCSHGNKGNDILPQIDALKSVIDQIKGGSDFIAGIMLESFIKKGKQDIKNIPLEYGLSVTDKCLGWEDTQEIIFYANETLS